MLLHEDLLHCMLHGRTFRSPSLQPVQKANSFEQFRSTLPTFIQLKRVSSTSMFLLQKHSHAAEYARIDEKKAKMRQDRGVRRSVKAIRLRLRLKGGLPGLNRVTFRPAKTALNPAANPDAKGGCGLFGLSPRAWEPTLTHAINQRLPRKGGGRRNG